MPGLPSTVQLVWAGQCWPASLVHTCVPGTEKRLRYRLGLLASISTKPLPLTTRTRTHNNNTYTHQGCTLGLSVASASRCKKPALHIDRRLSLIFAFSALFVKILSLRGLYRNICQSKSDYAVEELSAASVCDAVGCEMGELPASKNLTSASAVSDYETF